MAEQESPDESQEEHVYRVSWTIDVPARSPRDAAKAVLAIQQDPRSIATVFDVCQIDNEAREVPGTSQMIDLRGLETDEGPIEAGKGSKTSQVIAALIDQARSLGLEAEDLDEALHEAKTQEGSTINNEGLDSQIAYLVGAWGKEEVERMLRDTGVNKKRGFLMGTRKARLVEVSLFYVDPETEAMHLLGSKRGNPDDMATVERQLMDEHWDARLDAASCVPVFDVENIHPEPNDEET